MTTTTSDAQAGFQAVDAGTKPFLARFMALGDVEWEIAQIDPRLYCELRYQAMALLLCAPCFGIAIFNVAINLLGYPLFAAVLLGAVAAFGLYLIDQHFLIQGRGTGEDVRRSIIKVRIWSLAIIAISFALMATHSFRDDINRLLSEEGGKQRLQLAQSPQYRGALDSARQAVSSATAVVNRADVLRQQITRKESARSAALMETRNELEGNQTGNHTRVVGPGPKSRGFAAEANRLQDEIKADQLELSQLGDVAERLTKATQILRGIEERIERDVQITTKGASKKLDALFTLLSSNASACLAVLFWIAVGMIPDMLMWFAQGRSANHDLLANIRVLQREVLDARLSRRRAELRRQAGEGLMPMDVRLAATTQPAMAFSDTSARRAPAKTMAEEL